MNNNKEYCCYCGRWLVYPLRRTTEHLVPVSKKGSNNANNKRPCCDWCNVWRCNKPLEKWREEIQILITKGQIRPPHYSTADFHIMLENIDYLIDYIKTAGNLLKRVNNRAMKINFPGPDVKHT